MDKIKAYLISEKIHSNSKQAHDLFATQRFGEKDQDKIVYSIHETLYLIQKNKMDLYNLKEKKLSLNEIETKFQRIDKNFKIKYPVFKDLRQKGYKLKSALKFGADFRVYDKNQKIGQSHSRWLLFPVSENKKMTWQDFSAKNRVAHSTKKNLLIAIVDQENQISYYEIKWTKP
jgi:tRNA-intron endonuclease